MRTCRIAMVGAGGVAQRHLRVLSGFPDVALAGVTDVAHDAGRDVADRHGTRFYTDVADLLAAGPDAVYVCVPPFAHGPLERLIVAAGLPMFVEKPIAVDLPTAREIAAAVARRPLVTAVGHHWRYSHLVDRAVRLLKDRPVRAVIARWTDRVPPVAWWIRQDRSRGPLVAQAAHLLDLARLLVGEVTAVAAFGDGRPPPIDGADIDTATAAVLRFAGGAVGTVTSTCALDWKQYAGLEIVADGLVLELTEQELAVRDADGVRRWSAEPDDARVAVDRAFVDAVRGVGDDIRAPYAEALRTQGLSCAIAESARTGRPVALSPMALGDE